MSVIYGTDYSDLPLSAEDTFQNPSGCLKMWIVTNTIYSHLLVLAGDWFQNPQQIPKSADAKYLIWVGVVFACSLRTPSHILEFISRLLTIPNAM